MKPYPQTIVIQQLRQQRIRTRMSKAMELENVLGAIAPIRRKTAQAFIDYLGAMQRSSATLRTYAFALRTLEKVDKPYPEFTKDDLVFWLRRLEIDDGLKPGSINSYKTCVKPFFKWLLNPDPDSEEYPTVVKWMKCKSPKVDDERYIPSRAEILRMISAAECQRDRAMMFVLLESGARAGEFIRVRIKDVVFDKYGALVRVNGKTGERRIRLVESVPDLQLWLTMHPYKDDLDAMLWITTRQPYRPLTQIGLDMLIRKYCRIAKTGDSFGAHKFRHVQATEDAKHYPETTLRAKFGWSKDSDMPSIYVHQSARDTDGVILAHYGIKTEDNMVSANPSMPKVCPRCKHQNSAMAKFCMQCSAPLDAKTVIEIEAKNEQADEITSQVMAELIKRAPDVLAKILAETGLRTEINNVVKG